MFLLQEQCDQNCSNSFFSMDWIIVAQKLIKEINTENWNKIISWLVNKRALIDMINQIWMEFLKNEFIFCQNINVWLDMELKFFGIIALYINVTSFSSIPCCSNNDYFLNWEQDWTGSIKWKSRAQLRATKRPPLTRSSKPSVT